MSDGDYWDGYNAGRSDGEASARRSTDNYEKSILHLITTIVMSNVEYEDKDEFWKKSQSEVRRIAKGIRKDAESKNYFELILAPVYILGVCFEIIGGLFELFMKGVRRTLDEISR
ncbi:MAG: hypothetical protein IKE28_01285 [Solobacterium sp.]|nr:hypothetical protein [Solobacterium sp.]